MAPYLSHSTEWSVAKFGTFHSSPRTNDNAPNLSFSINSQWYDNREQSFNSILASMLAMINDFAVGAVVGNIGAFPIISSFILSRHNIAIISILPHIKVTVDPVTFPYSCKNILDYRRTDGWTQRICSNYKCFLFLFKNWDLNCLVLTKLPV